MKRRNLILILAGTTALSALALTAARARDVPKVATGFVANVVCTETFVSGLDPARVFAETTSAMPGAGLISWALDYRVDRARKDVTVTLFGLGRSHAVYRGEGLGCYLDHGGAVADISVPAPMQRRRCCLTSPVHPSSRRKRRNWLPRSTAPLPSRTSRRRAIRGRSWS